MNGFVRGLVVLFVANFAGCVAAHFTGCASLTPAERAEVATTAATIEGCQEIARACKADGGTGARCYAAYDTCITDAGLR